MPQACSKGVILEVGDMLVPLGCLLVKGSPLYLSLAGVINFTKKKRLLLIQHCLFFKLKYWSAFHVVLDSLH